MAVTIYDIADRMRLSHSAVSLALRDSPKVSKTTRARVRSLAAEMGYQPNIPARRLKTNETRMIAAILVLGQRQSAGLVEPVQSFFQAVDYNILWQNLPGDPAAQRKTFDFLCHGYVDAALVMMAEYAPVADAVRRFLKTGKPLAVIGPPPDLPPLAGLLPIQIDVRPAFRTLVDELVVQGHRHIAHIVGPKRNWHSLTSSEIIRAALRRRGLGDYDPTFEWPLDSGRDQMAEGHACAGAFLRARPEVTAVQTPNDRFCIGFLRGLADLGLRSPGDISLIGSDNLVDGEYSLTSLTTFDMNYREAARVGCEALLRHLGGEKWGDEPPEPVVVEGTLVRRESIGPAARMGAGEALARRTGGEV